MRQTSLNFLLGILGLAALLGLCGDMLLNVWPWGINVGLWTTALLAGVILLALRTNHLGLSGGGRWLALPILLFAFLFAWRDSEFLFLLNLLVLLVLFGIAGARTHANRVVISGLVDYAIDLTLSGLMAAFGFIALMFRVPWSHVASGRRSSVLLAVGRGLVVSFPLVLLFGGLLVAADAVFEGILRQILQIDIAALFSHSFWFCFWTWVAGGFVFQLFEPVMQREREHLTKPAYSAGMVEIGIVLGLLDLLFLAFVLVQFRYLFGGVSTLEVVPGLTYAQYARRGFFELVAVAALLLPLLLFAHWLLRQDRPGDVRAYRLLAGAMVVLVFVIMASALLRMSLYLEAYGLTELRLYTTAFMGWLALVFAWFALTVLPSRRQYFAVGALTAGLLIALLLNLLNPDDYITRSNLSRTDTAVPIDARYLAGLSGDAMPALIAGLSTLPEKDRCTAAGRIVVSWNPSRPRDVRSWNSGREAAFQVIQANWSHLLEMGRGCYPRSG